MKISLRKFLLIVWAMAVIGTGVLVAQATGTAEYGWAAGLSLLAISLGVPLMRALTEFSK